MCDDEQSLARWAQKTSRDEEEKNFKDILMICLPINVPLSQRGAVQKKFTFLADMSARWVGGGGEAKKI